MGFATVYSRLQKGLAALLINIEVHLSAGRPSFTIVGLAEKGLKESRDRIHSCLLNNGFDFPHAKIVVNLAPAELPKEGGRFDLAIALGILAASRQIPQQALQQYEFLAELGISGELRPTTGILAAALAVAEQSERALVLAPRNAKQASCIPSLPIYACQHLLEICAHLCGEKILSTYVPPSQAMTECPEVLDLLEIIGQAHGKRALEIAAAGGHHLLLHGPPGVGKSMLAHALPGLLPPLSAQQALEIANIHQLAQQSREDAHFFHRPFRSPHHSASAVSLIGGGNPPTPGEITLAHHGVLFLDEFVEFQGKVLDSLREPLESGRIYIARAGYHLEYPAQFQLVAAMNPCRCGYYSDPSNRCRCTPAQLSRYQQIISGPLLDRIDLCARLTRLPQPIHLQSNEATESSACVRDRVLIAQKKQKKRQQILNQVLTTRQLKQHAAISADISNILAQAGQRWHLSARALQRITKVARTIADLAGSEHIQNEHLLESLQFRTQAIWAGANWHR